MTPNERAVLATLTHRLRSDWQIADKLSLSVGVVRDCVRQMESASLVRVEAYGVARGVAITKKGREARKFAEEIGP